MRTHSKIILLCIALCASYGSNAQKVSGFGKPKTSTIITKVDTTATTKNGPTLEKQVLNNTTQTSNSAAKDTTVTTQNSDASAALGALLEAMGNQGGASTTQSGTTTQQGNTTTSQGGDASAALGALLEAMGNQGGASTPQSGTTTQQGNKTTSSQSNSGSSIGSLLESLGGMGGSATGSSNETDALTSTLGSILGSVLGSNKDLTVEDLQGNWVYAAPACKFKSDDFLKSAGGDLVASQISQKLAPLYEKIGVTTEKFAILFDDKGTYTLTYGQIPLQGGVKKSEETGFFDFEFIKIGDLALATTPTYIEKSGNTMLLLYEADKLVALMRDIVGVLGISTLDCIFQLLDEYEGVLIGFEMKKS